MKKILKNTTLLLAAAAAVSLTACSNGNPLEKQSPQTVNTFLKEASSFAERKVDYNLGDRQGVMYAGCMLGRFNDKPDFCPTLYADMVSYAKTSKGPFSKLTVAELKDKKAYDKRKNQPAKFGQMS